MTLNQQYKSSGSTKSFKDWVFEQQKEGSLDFNTQEVMKQETQDDKPMDISIFGVPVKYLGLGIIVLIGGIWAYRKFAK